MSMNWRPRISMLGSLRVQQGEREVSRFRTERTAALLAYLAYHLEESHPREVLAETIWPGQTPRAGRNSLNTAVSSLRRQLEPPGVPRGTIIQSDRFAVQLNPSAVTTDVREFEAALQRASDADSIATRLQHLTDAVGLYRGELLPGLYDEWVVTEQRRLADQCFEAALALSALLERAGDHEGAVAVTRQAITRDPLREEAHYELMRLHAASGEPVAALRHYAELKDLLAKELGQEPSPATAQLAQAIRAAEPEVRAPRPSRREDAAPQASVPASGMVTFLLTDIEGGMALSESMGEAFKEALETYRSLLGREFRRHGAQGVRETGTSFVAPFGNAMDAIECAVACQELLAAQSWPPQVGPLRVRMALYTGDVWLPGAEARDGVLTRASRLLSVAHGGQVLCGEATAALLKRDRRQATHLANLGTYRLRDVPTPEKLFQVSYSGMHTVEFPPLQAEAGYADNLPLQLTRFFGRKREREELRALVRDEGQRLVTLTGPGGSGKTRLALEVARELLGDFDGAVWFVPLADLRDAELIPGAIADALGLQRSPHLDPLDQVAAVLREQSSLLILDNLEQLGQAVGPIVLALLERVRTATWLATSRRPLDLPGERLYSVPPLLTPEAPASAEELLEYASVRLFVDRAQAARPDFQLTQSNAKTIAVLCERLDGVPLAIELAAARAQAMATDQMLAQLHRPFDFLVSRRQVTEERHRTLEVAIDWSYQLLPGELQRFFARLSVFRGGCTLEAAQAVCEEPRALEYLEELTASSLLIAEETDGVMRFRLLETLREYGRQRLSGSALHRLRRRHAEWFLELLRMYDSHHRTARGAESLDRVEAEFGNLQAAMDWCSSEDGDPGLGLMLATQARTPWQLRGHLREAHRCLLRAAEQVEPKDDAARDLQARALCDSGYLAHLQGDSDAGTTLCERGLHLYRSRGNKDGIVRCLSALAEIGLERGGDYDLARAQLKQALALMPEAKDQSQSTAVLTALGRLDFAQGDYHGAERHFREALEVCRELGDQAHEGGLVLRQASLHGCQGDHEASRQAAEEALYIFRERSDPWGICEALGALGVLALQLGQNLVARQYFEEGLRIYRELGARRGEANRLNALGLIALRLGDYAQASRLHQQALRIARELRVPTEIAMALEGLAVVAAQGHRTDQEVQLKSEALRLWHGTGEQRRIAENLEGIARTMVALGRAGLGATLLGAAEALRETMGSPLHPSGVEAVAATRSALRERLGVVEYDAALDRGRQMALDDAVRLALETLTSSGGRCAPPPTDAS